MDSYLTKYKPELSSVFEQFEVEKSEEDYVFKIYQNLLLAKRNHEVLFLVIGKLLKEIRDNKLHEKLDYDTFGDFLNSEEVSFSRESAYMYIRVYEYYIEYLQLDESRVADINVSRLSLMMPILRKIEDKQEALEKIEELNTLRHGDFILKVKQQKASDKPSVYYSQELDQWIISFFSNRTTLHDLGNFTEYMEK
jgi:hypothetical protein